MVDELTNKVKKIPQVQVANDFIFVQDTNKLSPLLLAVSKGNEMIVRNLLLAGASVDDVNPSGQTALQIAAENGLSEIARFTEFHQKNRKH